MHAIPPSRLFRTIVLAFILPVVQSACFAQSQHPLTHHVPQAVQRGSAKSVEHLRGNQTLRLTLTLHLPNQTELENFIQAVSNPSSPSYHQYLTVEEFTERFGPSQQDYDSVIHFAETNGLKVVGTSRNRLNVDVEGQVSQIEHAFNLRLNSYQHPTEKRTFYAPDREPTEDLSVGLWHISGLDNYSIPQPMLSTKPADQLSLAPDATTGSGPSASFLGSDMRAAYYGGTTLTGSGQSLGLLEYYGTNLADVNTYLQNIGQTNQVPITLLSTDGTSTSCLASSGCSDTEQTLDITQAIGMAPGLSSLVVYVGSTDAHILNAMATANPLNAQLSISWAWTPPDPATDDPYFMEFAAQGQSVFAAAGDSGSWTSTANAFPADDPYVTSVGGTDLQTSSAAGPWSSETAWANGGGGISPDYYLIPSWQTAAAVSCPLCSTAYRDGPDISGNSNWTFYVCSNQTACTANYWGGTSFAAPMWAGYLALANQQSVAQGNGTLGFINPALYALASGSGYSADFHDVTSGSNGYAAASGFDLATGLGSPNGAALINALTLVPSFDLAAGATSLSVAPGNSGSKPITTTVFAGFNAALALSASGQPTGVTVSFNPTSIGAPGNGSSQMTITVASSVAPGTYPITITATGGGVTQTTAVSLVVAAPTFSLSESPGSLVISQGTTGTTTITVVPQNGFSGNVTLSAINLPSGVTASFHPNPTHSTSVLTLTASSTAATGQFYVSITGTSGTTTEYAPNLVLGVVQPPTINASPAAVTLAPGATQNTGILVQNLIGGMSMAFTASGLPSGVTATFSPNPLTSGSTSVLQFSATSAAVPGTYNVTVVGSSGTFTPATSVALTITQPTFTLSSSLGSGGMLQGSSLLSTITVHPQPGFGGNVTLSASGMPSGLTASFAPNPTAGTSVLTLTASPTATIWTGYVKITGTSGMLTASTTIYLSIVAAPPGFTLTPSPSTLTVYQGQSGTSTITSTLSGGLDSAISLSSGVLPPGPGPGVNVSFSPSTLPAPGSGTSTMTVSVASTVPPGTYGIEIGGSAGSFTSNTTSISLTVAPSPGFDSVNVGATSPAIPISFAFSSPVTLGSKGVLTQGATGLDFTDAGTDTCTPNTAYSAGQTCTINVTFTPEYAGARYGAALLKDTNGNVISTVYLRGTGVGPQVVFMPGVQNTVAGSLPWAAGVATDAGGNLYVSTSLNQVYKETLSGGVYTQSAIPTSALNSPMGVALDGAGDVYIADTGNYRILRETPSSTGYAESVVATLSAAPVGVAVDGSGNVYISAANGALYLESLVDGSYVQSTIPTGLTSAAGVAVDATGNVYVVSNVDGGSILKETSASGSYTQSAIGTLSSDAVPFGISVDAVGNVYVTSISSTSAGIVKLAPSSGGYVQSAVAVTGLNQSQAITTDAAGNLYVADSGNFRVVKLDFADPPSLTFAATPVGSTSSDSPQTVTLVNSGNADLALPVPASGSNPSITANFTLDDNAPSACPVVAASASNPGVLAAGSSCALAISFMPATPGADSGSLVLTDNALNAAAPGYTAQTILLSGTATPGPATMLSPAPGSTLTTPTPTFTWTAGTGASYYYLWIGTTPGSHDLLELGTSATSYRPTLPANGATVYVRLYSVINGALQYNDYIYTEVAPGVPAAMIAPVPGSTLATGSTTFTWTAGTGASYYYLWIGTTPGSHDLVELGTSTTSYSRTLPANGATVYVRLYSQINNIQKYADYTYTEAAPRVPAAMIAPTPGSMLTTSTPTFTWTAGTGVSYYYLWIGTTLGSHNLVEAGTAATSLTHLLPTGGATLYVRLYSVINGALQYNDYSYTEENPTAATMLSPAPGSTLTTSAPTFTWTAGSGVSYYYVWIGTTPGSHNLVEVGTSANSLTHVLPTGGATLYVRLYSVIDGALQYNDYSYTEAGQ